MVEKLSERSPIDKDEDFEEEIHEGDIYDEEGREELISEDEIQNAEEGFVEGFEHGEHEAKCAQCDKILDDYSEKIIEEEINEEYYRFCSEECANLFEVGKKIKRGR